MLATKLIVIDGLSGSGKTTTAKWLNQQLEAYGIRPRYLPEYDIAHPLWWYEYWDGAEYLPPDFENIPIERFIENSLMRWRNFSTVLQEPGQPLVVAESIFFLNAVGIFLMGGAAPIQLMKYAQEVQEIARACSLCSSTSVKMIQLLPCTVLLPYAGQNSSGNCLQIWKASPISNIGT